MSDEIKFDWDRDQRIGFGEAVLCTGKRTEQISEVLRQAKSEDRSVLLTRLAASRLAKLPEVYQPDIDYDPTSKTAFYNFQDNGENSPAEIAIVTGGSSDARPAREAERTLRFNGHASTVIFDVGVAGLWRLTDRLDEIKRHKIVIAVAGMDAALVSVLGGLVPGLIIAVPTSTGYGASRRGETALAASLASCSPGVVVVNIDNGYGAACAAMRALSIS